MPYNLYMYAGENSVQQEGREEEDVKIKLKVLSYQETHSDDRCHIRNKLAGRLHGWNLQC